MLDFTNLSRRQTRFGINLVSFSLPLSSLEPLSLVDVALLHLGRGHLDSGHSGWYHSSSTLAAQLDRPLPKRLDFVVAFSNASLLICVL